MSETAFDTSVDGAGAPETYASGGDDWSFTRDQYDGLMATQTQLRGLMESLYEATSTHAEEQHAHEDEQAWDEWNQLLDPWSDNYDARTVAELAQAVFEQEAAPLREYVAQMQQAHERDQAEDRACEIMEGLGVPEDAMGHVYEAASARINEAVRRVGGSSFDDLAAWACAQTGMSHGDVSLAIAQEALAVAAHEHSSANAPRPDSLKELARQYTQGVPRDTRGRFVSRERPDSLVDLARRFTTGAAR